MIKFLRTSPKNTDFSNLVTNLDRELAITDGDDHAFYDQFNKSDQIKYCIVVYKNQIPVGCGAIKEFREGDIMEIKRMFVLKENRGEGIASAILKELESWAKELGYNSCILETGINQPDALALYKKNGFELISNYGQYAGIENSFCFQKKL